MFRSFMKTWFARRRHLRSMWKADARELIARDERNAYYDAQRLAARCRAAGDTAGFVHWAKAAADVARVSSVADMNMSVVDAIVTEEMHRGTGS
jgi:hypothetical protein